MDLDGLLKSKQVAVKGLGKVTVYELSWGAQMEIQEAVDAGKTGLAGALTVKHGLKLDQPVDEVAEKMPVSVVNEVSDAVWELLGLEDEVKNSESTPGENSHSN